MLSIEERLAALEYLAAVTMAAEMRGRMGLPQMSRDEAIAEAGAFEHEAEFQAVEAIKARAVTILDVMLARST